MAAQLHPGFTGVSPPPPSWLFRPSPPPPPLSNDKPYPQGRIVVNICIGVVTTYIVLSTIYALFKGYRNRRAHAAAAAADTRRSPLPEHGSALDERQPRQAGAPVPTAGLPAFVYGLSAKHNVTDDGEEAATCSVCLGAFQLGETVRLLPVCLHLYHADCIDPWLEAHSTCPLCRSFTDPTSGIGRLPPV